MDEFSKVEQKIQEGNAWYTADQKSSCDQQYPLVSARRVRFLLAAIDGYLKDHKTADVHFGDLGCGDGYYLEKVAHAFPSLTLSGTDYNRLRLERAQQRVPRASFSRQDILKTSFPDSCFDIIFFSQVLEHVPNDEAALLELRRILKPTGILILGTPNEGCLMGRLQYRLFQRWLNQSTDHVHFYTRQTLKRLLKKAGFEARKIQPEHWLVPYTTVEEKLTANKWSYGLLLFLSAVFPSQAAGYYFELRKEASL